MTRAGLALLLLAACQARQVPAPEEMRVATAVQVASRDARTHTHTHREFVQRFGATIAKQLPEQRITTATMGSPEEVEHSYALINQTALDAESALAQQELSHYAIIEPHPDTKNEFPECVALGTDSRWLCSGVLLGPNTVATAGHCLEQAAAHNETLTRVSFGLTFTGARPATVASAMQAQYYVPNGRKNDLALVILDGASLDDAMRSVPPIRIAPTTLTTSAGAVREAGFGNTTNTSGSGTRNWADVAMATSTCKPDAPTTYDCNERLEFVAKPIATPAGVCFGDSGGPAYVRDGDRWYVAGIASRPARGATGCGGSAIFVRLDQYVDWMKTVPGAHLLP